MTRTRNDDDEEDDLLAGDDDDVGLVSLCVEQAVHPITGIPEAERKR